MGDLVGDAEIDLVSDAGDHRMRASGDRHGDALVVEGGKFVLRTAAANDHHDVNVVAQARGSNRVGNHLRGLVTLHPHVVLENPETEL